MDDLDKKIKHLWKEARTGAAAGKGRACPGDSTLASYIDGVLSEREKEDMEEHLLACGDCLDLLVLQGKVRDAELREQRATGDVPERLIKRAKGLIPDKGGFFDVVVSLISDTVRVLSCAGGFEMQPPLAPALVRGPGSQEPSIVELRKSFDDMDAVFEIEASGEGLCTIRLAAAEKKGQGLPGALRVELVSGGRELVSSLLEKGQGTLEDIAPGTYVLRISGKKKVLGEVNLKIE